MFNPLIIDGYDAYDTFGVYLADAAMREIVQMPKFKDSSIHVNDWHEENGIEADLTNPVLEPRQLQLQFRCTRRVLNATAQAFVDYLSRSVYHTFYFPRLKITWTLRYVSSPSSKINEYFDTFSLSFCEDTPAISAATPTVAAKFQSAYAIDGIRISYYGFYETEGTLSLFHPLDAVKENKSSSVSIASGVSYDSTGSRTKKYPDIKLNIYIRTNTVEDFWHDYYALFTALTSKNSDQQAVHTISDGTISAVCYYKSSSVSRFSLLKNNTVDNAGVWCSLSITLAVLSVTQVDPSFTYLSSEEADAIVSQNPYPEFILVDPAAETPSEDDDDDEVLAGLRGVKITDLPSIGTSVEAISALTTLGVNGIGQSVQVPLGSVIEAFINSIGGCLRLTTEQFEALTVIDERRWYFVTDYRGQLKFIYAGSTLFAKADIQGDMGFPYTFPITF